MVCGRSVAFPRRSVNMKCNWLTRRGIRDVARFSWLKSRVILALKTDALTGRLLPPIDRYMRSAKAVAAARHRLPDIRDKISAERWLCLSLHSSSKERVTLIDYHDYGARRPPSHWAYRRNEPLSAACFSLEGVSACSRSS